MRNYFPKRPSGAPLHTLSKLYDVPVGFVTPPYFEAEYCLFFGRRRVAVARYRMICLVLLRSICNGYGMPAGNAHLPDISFRTPFLGLAYTPIVETSFPELAVSFLDFAY